MKEMCGFISQFFSIRLIAIIFNSVNFNNPFGRRLRSKSAMSLVMNRCNVLVPEVVCQNFG
jgi:hypothetical protein